MKREWIKGDVCDVSSRKFNELRSQGFNGTATFAHQRIIDRIHPTVTLKMRNGKERIALKWIGQGDRNLHLYSGL